jgi:hypothetical protein
MKPTWKCLAGSLAGTSHGRSGQPCQDYAAVRLIDSPGSTSLLLVCADGAGSAAHADAGARLACCAFLTAAASAIEGCTQLALSPESAIGWFHQARCRLSQEAGVRGAELREFACTLLAVVVGERSALFAQLGDGAIVFRQGDDLQTAFWPQSGEYANTTYFLTDPNFEERIGVRAVEPAPDEVAVITDGLQPLALSYAARRVHAPFFEPMFATLRGVDDPDRLQLPLQQFLGSKPVTDRTDDDKTLIVATRRAPGNESDHPRQ